MADLEQNQVRHCTVSTTTTKAKNGNGGGNESILEISFPHPETNVAVTLHRDPAELYSKLINRLQATVDKKTSKVLKKKGSWHVSLDLKADEVQDVAISEAFQTSSTLLFAFQKKNEDGNMKSVPICYPILRNLPRILELTVTDLPIVGFPVVCCIKSEHCTSLRVDWFVGGQLERSDNNTVDEHNEESFAFFIPTAGMLGQKMKVRCLPSSSTCGGESVGHQASAEGNHKIHCLKESCASNPMLERASELGPPPSECIRLMTYNVMWMRNSKSDQQVTPIKDDQFIGKDRSFIISDIADLPVPIDSRTYRQHMLAREIMEYQPSILCLQEVVDVFMDSHLNPLLEQRAGYKSVWDPGSELATLYDHKRFVKIAQVEWKIADLLDMPINQEILEACRQHPEALEFLRSQPHIAQALCLEDCISGQSICIVNCHLVQKPVVEQMRAIQTALLVRSVQHWKNEAMSRNGRPEQVGGPLLAGDFNVIYDVSGDPDGVCEGALALLKGGSLSSSHYAFVHGRHFARKRFLEPPSHSRCKFLKGEDQCRNFKWNKSLVGYCWDHTCLTCNKGRSCWKVPVCRECSTGSTSAAPSPPGDVDGGIFCCDLDLQGLKFADAYENATGIKAPFWNLYHGEFVAGARDHIFYDESCFKLLNVATPTRPEEAMPSLTWPSDHMSLVADFQLLL